MRDVYTSTNFFSRRTAVGFRSNLHLILLLPACLLHLPDGRCIPAFAS